MESLIAASYSVCRIDGGREALVLGALRLPGTQAAEKLEERLQEALELNGITGAYDEGCCSASHPGFRFDTLKSRALPAARQALKLADEAGVSFACAYQLISRLPKEGSCVALYQLFRVVTGPWNKAGNHTSLVVDDGFDASPCGGRGCRYAYVGGSDCQSRLGEPVGEDQAHLRIADLATSLERTTSPLARLEVRERQGGLGALFALCDLMSAAVCHVWSAGRPDAAKAEICDAVLSLGPSRLRFCDCHGRRERIGPKRRVRKTHVVTHGKKVG